MCIALLSVLWRKRKLEDYRYFAAYIGCRIAEACCAMAFLYFRRNLGIDAIFGYTCFVYSEEVFLFIQTVLTLLTIYAVYRLAMRGLPGLQDIGQVIFRWIAGVSFGLALLFSLGPHSSTDRFGLLQGQIHQGISVLALCLLLFVCLAIKPLGLSFRSQVFGVALGFGLGSGIMLVQAAWLPTEWGHNLASPLFAITGCISLGMSIVWLVYFALPEPERRMILLPTTSPFFVWNSISEALGDDPGFVAVSGFKPDMLSQAEIEEMSRSLHSDDVARTPTPSELGLTGISAS